jgi:thiol-disulfide isomerase/thioredoxin
MAATAMTAIATQLGMLRPASARVGRTLRLDSQGEMPSLAGATQWLNSPPLTVDGLRGKVVLVPFWTYTCINWLRSLPYVRAWAEKYTDRGIVVIGAHAPEFGFEKDVDNVRRAARTMRIPYPIAVGPLTPTPRRRSSPPGTGAPTAAFAGTAAG